MQTRLFAVLAICLAASLPYASTLNNYFVNDDFGVVQLLTQKPLLYFPKWFVTSWMDNIWGATQDEIRPFPAVTYQLAGLWGATSPVANHAANIAFHAATRPHPPEKPTEQRNGRGRNGSRRWFDQKCKMW